VAVRSPFFRFIVCLIWFTGELWGFPHIAFATEPKDLKVTVTIEGLEGPALNNARTSLSLEKQKDNPRLSDRRIKALHREAPGEIRQALQALGYYRPEIHPDLRRMGGQWLARYRIIQGPPLQVRKLEIVLQGEGKDDKSFHEAVRKFPLKAGDVLRHDHYEKGKKRLMQIASERGYLDARFVRHEIQVDLKTYEARGWLHFDTGPRYRFGAVKFPETPLNPEVLERLTPFKEGDPYETAKLLALQDALTNSNYFANIEVSPQREAGVVDKVPVKVQLEARKRHHFTAGVGFSTDTGPRVTADWEARYINRRGHRVKTEIDLSPAWSEMSGRYIIPGYPGFSGERDAQLEISANALRKETDTSKSLSAQAGVAHTWDLWGWDQTLSLRYLFEDFEVGGISETTRLLLAGAGWRRVVTDDPLFTSNGWRAGLDLQGGHESLLSESSVARVKFQGKYIHSFTPRDRFIARGDLGGMLVSRFEKLPASLRFFAGGDVSVRGFGFEELGPKDAAGRVVGGRYLAVGSLEYEHYFLEKWGAAIFADAGNAFDSLGDEMAYGFGIGARWRSPIGLVRADVATGFFDGATTFHIHIVLGPDL
jgi:translocation and assembly module TamA